VRALSKQREIDLLSKRVYNKRRIPDAAEMENLKEPVMNRFKG
jgi:hypothetical protein